jgi:TRAP transporter TAXI family solute receptor
LKSRGALANLRQIAALFPEDIQIVVRADGDIKALRDLKGKRLSLGEPGSGTIVDARLVLDAAGVSECDVKPQYLRLSRAVEALQGNEIDGFVIVAGAPVPAIVELASLVPIRLVPIDPAVQTKLMGRPPFYHADTIANGTYPGLDADIATVSVMALWIVGAAAPEDLIYAVTKALWQEQTRRLLDFASPVGKRIRIATALTEPGVPLHPGAARYYRERGMELPPMER